jgi:serine protease Do
MDTTEQSVPVTVSGNQNTKPKIGVVFFVLTIIISLIFGSLGGAAGAFYLLREPAGQKLLAMSGGQSVNQKVNLTEDSGIINVVQKDSPAVVSIVVSQDLNQIPGYGTNSFNDQDPFNFFFNGGSSQQQQPQSQTTPNVQEIAAGSGFFVSSDGLILTNKHVVSEADASYTVITSDGKTYDAKVVAQDPVEDLALVKISISGAQYLTFSDSSQIQTGQPVIAIGNSLGQYQNTVTSGIISGIGRSITAGGEDGSEDLSGVIQTDAAINPGNSGGPLLNIVGQVIGINTAIDQQGQLVGFAIPSNIAAKSVASYQKNGKIIHSFLGVRYVMITDAIAKQQNLQESYGALIVRGDTQMDFAVQPGSPADKAGLVENDIILEVNGTKVDDQNALSDLLQNFNPGDNVTLQVYHKGKIENLQVTLGSTPSS